MKSLFSFIRFDQVGIFFGPLMPQSKSHYDLKVYKLLSTIFKSYKTVVFCKGTNGNQWPIGVLLRQG